jgi:hypothetical protein
MNKEDIQDLNGKTPSIGDTIAVSVGWMSNDSYIAIATVDSFTETPKTVTMNFSISKSGLGGYEDYGTIRKSSLRFPSKHTKFIILPK